MVERYQGKDKEAAKWMRVIAEQDGSARAQYKLGSIYDEGKGVPEDERIGIITGLFDRKSEYRIRSVACLFYGRV